jgi:hypothetical protein
MRHMMTMDDNRKFYKKLILSIKQILCTPPFNSGEVNSFASNNFILFYGSVACRETKNCFKILAKEIFSSGFHEILQHK